MAGIAYRRRFSLAVYGLRSRSDDRPIQGGKEYSQCDSARGIFDITKRQLRVSAAVFFCFVVCTAEEGASRYFADGTAFEIATAFFVRERYSACRGDEG